ncbi:unnamed protein product [Fraxinus pennsylvanica]|uniref:Uncharacterized protein n=1 Tax=Fraxinus pennsylvanica TaxID=56036 RepID=A0AAD1Z2H3_9LAMI|nr:unnamed protein product [Fraxinus pennsylvanica]
MNLPSQDYRRQGLKTLQSDHQEQKPLKRTIEPIASRLDDDIYSAKSLCFRHLKNLYTIFAKTCCPAVVLFFLVPAVFPPFFVSKFYVDTMGLLAPSSEIYGLQLASSEVMHPPIVTYPSEMDGIPRNRLPVFGLASYKYKDSLWTSNAGCQCQSANSLLQAVDDWLTLRYVNHPDFLFFCR